MKTNPYYTLCKIDDAFYLLPFGQAIADQNRGMQLSSSGIFLWNTLPEVESREELLDKFLTHYQAEEEDIPILTQDLDHFLFLLTSLGILLKDWKEPVTTEDSSLYLQIGSVRFCLLGMQKLFPKEFTPYSINPCHSVDLTIRLKEGQHTVSDNGTLLIHNKELCVWEQTDRYRLLFPESKHLTEAYLSMDGTYSCIYYRSFSKELLPELFHAIRLLYLYTARLHNSYALHSASILYQGKAWLFAGHSGMGKSTHTNLWKKLFHTPVLNGDLNLLSFQNDKPVIYGIPWCGTSGISTPDTYPLGGIILLSQAEQDECLELSHDKQSLLIMQRLISPAWTLTMLQDNLEFTNRLSKHIKVCQLRCTQNTSAAYIMKQWIDNHITK